MKNIILVIQIITSISLIALILIQSGSSGLGRSFGGGGSFTRRGLEKFLYKLTYVFSGIFILVSILSLII